MRRQGLAEKTRSAYRVDLAQLGEWAGAQHLDPEQLDFRGLRRFAGVLSERGSRAPRWRASSPRSAPSTRSAVERGGSAASPADLVASAEARVAPAARVQARRGGDATGAHARLHPARAARPGHVRAGVLGRAARRGARGPGPSSSSTSTPRSCASRARAGAPASSPAGSRRGGRSRAYLERGAAGAAGPRIARRRCSCRSPAERSRPPTSAPPAASGRARRRCSGASPRTPSGTRSRPTAGGRSRSARDPGAARATPPSPRPRLHSGRVAPLEEGVRAGAPPRLTRRQSWRPT